MASWEHFSHGSDNGVRGIGSSAEEAFEQAAIALTAVVADVGAVAQASRQFHFCPPSIALVPAPFISPRLLKRTTVTRITVLFLAV